MDEQIIEGMARDAKLREATRSYAWRSEEMGVGRMTLRQELHICLGLDSCYARMLDLTIDISSPAMRAQNNARSCFKSKSFPTLVHEVKRTV